jgi:hypothetical protein
MINEEFYLFMCAGLLWLAVFVAAVVFEYRRIKAREAKMAKERRKK